MDIEKLNIARKIQDELERNLSEMEMWEKWNDEENYIFIGSYKSNDRLEYSMPAPTIDCVDFQELKMKMIARLEANVSELKQQLEQL